MVRVLKCFVFLAVFAFVLGVVGVAIADEAKGKVKSVDADKGTIVVTVDGKDTTFSADKATIGKTKAGDEVTVTYKKEGDKMTASAIKGKETPKKDSK
jgi:PDZ domain-containing secreted protein